MGHRRRIRQLSGSDELADAIALGQWETAPVSDSDRAMLKYVVKLTERPGDMTEADVQELREAGFSDGAIGDIALNTALFAMTNRLVDGLGGKPPESSIETAERLGVLEWDAELLAEARS